MPSATEQTKSLSSSYVTLLFIVLYFVLSTHCRVQTEKLSKIRELENTQYFRDIKAARETLKNDIYPRLEEIKSEETKIRSVIDAEKNTGKQLVQPTPLSFLNIPCDISNS